MPTTYVTGGGDALQNALLASASTSAVNQNHIFNIDDGVYNPITFGSWLSGWRNSTFILSSLHGPEHCIIDGGTKWENDVFNSTLISAGSYCLYVNSGALPGYFGLVCYGITFRNAYGSNGCVFFENGNNKSLSNCIVENAFFTTNRGAIGSSEGNCHVYNLSCRNINGLRNAVKNVGQMHNSLIENCVSRGDSLFNQTEMNKCTIRNCSANTFMEYAANMQECLVYDISCTRFLHNMRLNNLAGNTFSINLLANSTLTAFNGNGTRIIANNIFASTTNYNFTIASNVNGQVMSVFNNYAAAFTGLCCNDCVTGTNPGFVDPSEEDYHLAAGSPCISAGSWARKAYSRDLDGKYWKNPPSIGCYEFYKSIEGEIPNYINPIGQRERAPWSEIEYLESTGTQWIDTGIIPMSSTIWNLDFAFTTVNVNNGCGCAARQNTGGGMTIRQRDNGATMLYCKSNSIISRDTTVASNVNRHQMTMQASHAGIYLDGAWRDTTYGTAAWQNSGNTMTMKLFGFYEKLGTIDKVYPAHMRIYSSSMSNENGRVFDLVPFRVGNVGYIFDKVTKKLFKNQGTGVFILGPDKN